MRSAAGLRRARWGSFSAPPDSLAAIGGGVPASKGKGREWEKKCKGRAREREREKERAGEGKKGKDDLHPTLF